MPTNRRNVKSDAGSHPADAHERARDFLGEAEIARLLKAAKRGRHGVRDHLLLLLMFRHGLHVSEAIALRRSDADLDQARLWISRLKNGLSGEQPIAGDELRAIGRWLALRDDTLPWLFVSERRQPLTRQTVNYIVARAGKQAKPGHINPHMLRHSCGFAHANKGHDLRLIQDYLGSGSATYRALHAHSRRSVRRALVEGTNK
ncbi:MAG: tyrosine-type recombinase/integrase [Litoreibacter sp.]|nr:tyrosine-type recombinase/integrase [Litoreibacter sp.]